jgi:toxin FitB
LRFLLDTNVISELRKGARASRGVVKWAASTEPAAQHTSVLVIGELRHSVELRRRSDVTQAAVLEAWLEHAVRSFGGRIFPVDAEIADAWGRLGVPDPLPDIDGLLAATALVHNLTIVTRDKALLGLKVIRTIDPFEAA